MYGLFLLYFGPTLSQVDAVMQYIIPMWLVIQFIKLRPSRTLSVPA